MVILPSSVLDADQFDLVGFIQTVLRVVLNNHLGKYISSKPQLVVGNLLSRKSIRLTQAFKNYLTHTKSINSSDKNGCQEVQKGAVYRD